MHARPDQTNRRMYSVTSTRVVGRHDESLMLIWRIVSTFVQHVVSHDQLPEKGKKNKVITVSTRKKLKRNVQSFFYFLKEQLRKLIKRQVITASLYTNRTLETVHAHCTSDTLIDRQKCQYFYFTLPVYCEVANLPQNRAGLVAVTFATATARK